MRLNKIKKNNVKKRGMAMLLGISLCMSMFSGMQVSNVSAAEHSSKSKKAEVVNADNDEEVKEDKDIVFDASNEDGEYAVSVTNSGSFSIINYENTDKEVESIKWSVGDESIVKVENLDDFKASYTALSPGRVNIYVDVTYSTNSTDEQENADEQESTDEQTGTDNSENSTYLDRYTFSLCVYPDMSGVEVTETSQTKYITAYDDNVKFTFKMKSDILLDEDNSDVGFEANSSNKSMSISASLKDNVVSIWAYKAGQTKVTFKIYDKEFEVSIKVVKISLNKNTLLIIKGRTANVKLKGVSNGIKWSSNRKKIVSVNSKGKIKARRIGTAVIIANVDGTKVGCAVSVVSPKIYKVIKRGRSIAKGTYSQARRMSANYYDCSSLVWRAYSKYGTYFGARSYAPVAADICRWCWSSKSKRISSGLKDSQIQNMKLRAGDLIFKTGAKNGRYKGIYHVEMFAGYSCIGFRANGKPKLTAVWVNRAQGYYAYGSLVARP